MGKKKNKINTQAQALVNNNNQAIISDAKTRAIQKRQILNKKPNKGQKKKKKGAITKQTQKNSSNQQEIAQIQEQNELIQSLTSSINSQQLQQLQGQVQFNPKGKQGFDDLINANQNQINNQVKQIQYQRQNNILNQQNNIYYLYVLNKDVFYKVTSLNHQRLNHTHLNQIAIVNLLQQFSFPPKNHLLQNCFMQNGKLLNHQLNFVKSTVFKIIKKAIPCVDDQINQQKDKINKKKEVLKSKRNQLMQYIRRQIKPKESYIQSVMSTLQQIQWCQECLLLSSQPLHLSQTTIPFQNLNYSLLNTNNSLLIIGKKNTGKSTLTQFIRNGKQDVCVIDCDLGRSLTVNGCVSLITQNQSFNMWIGEFTPFNSIQTYLKAIQILYNLYRQKYFAKKLIINTMGYLSGLGEIILYQIYNIINPSQIIVLRSKQCQLQSKSYDNIYSILENLKSGKYLSKLLKPSQQIILQKSFSKKHSNLNISYLQNFHAQSKGLPIRFQNLISPKKNIKNVIQLIQMIKKKQLIEVDGEKYQQDKFGNLTKFYGNVDMRIVLIGKMFKQLFRVLKVAYAYQAKTYCDKSIIQQLTSKNISVGDCQQPVIQLVTQGIDFQKNFYQMSEVALIDHQLQYGNIPFLLPIIKGLGSKGIRNNPGKGL